MCFFVYNCCFFYYVGKIVAFLGVILTCFFIYEIFSKSRGNFVFSFFIILENEKVNNFTSEKEHR